MSTQVVSIDRGPNWGGAFQSLAQGLLGIYQQQEQEKLRQQERQQQLADLSNQRAYEQRLWDQRHPMTTLPSQFTETPTDFAAPNPQFQPWMSAFPAGAQIPQEDFGRYAFDWATRKQPEPGSWLQLDTGQLVPLSNPGLLTDGRNRAVPVNMAGPDGGSVWRQVVDPMPTRTGGGNDTTKAKAFLSAVISDDERKLRGDAYASAVEQQMYQDMYLFSLAGKDFTAADAQESENKVRARSAVDPSYLPPQFGAVLGNPKRVVVDGKGYWYDPTIQEAVDAKVVDRPWWKGGDQKVEASYGIKAGAESEAAQRGIADDLGGFATDDEIIKKVLPWVQKMAASGEELTLWANQNGLTRAELETVIGRVMAQPNDIDKKNANEF